MKLATQFEVVEAALIGAEKSRDEATSDYKNIALNLQEQTLRANLAEREVEIMKEQMKDWEATKESHLQAAKASMLDASAQLSNKLLEDHKRENQQTKAESEQMVKKTTEELQQNFKNVFSNMKSLTDRVENFGSSVDVIQNSLLNPQGAGQLAEVTLENILKNSGLEDGRDYKMQFSLESMESGKKLRPDALVYLPGDRAIIIDSKSSKFFLELGKASEDERALKEIELRNSMNKHLNDLISKDYKKNVEDSIESKDKKIVQMLMFVPTEEAARTVMNVDTKFFEKAISNNIILVGPSGLVNILMQAKMIIDRAKQDENYLKIIDEVGKLIDSVAKLHIHAESMGKSLSSSMDKYNKFVGSFNVGLLSKVNKIKAYGVNDKADKNIARLVKYETLKSEQLD